MSSNTRPDLSSLCHIYWAKTLYHKVKNISWKDTNKIELATFVLELMPLNNRVALTKAKCIDPNANFNIFNSAPCGYAKECQKVIEIHTLP